jgi:hypothetical protein
MHTTTRLKLAGILSIILALVLAAVGSAPAQDAAPNSREAKYQTAIKNGQEAESQHFYVSALTYYQQALKLKPGDPTATKLAADVEAKIEAKMHRGQPGVPPVVPPPVVPPPAPATPAPATPAAVTPAEVPSQAANQAGPVMPAPKPKSYKNEISASADFLLGEGYVTLPVFYSLQKAPNQVPGSIISQLTPFIASPDRNSDYFGGTVSYSRGQSLFLDLSYAHGTSSGDQQLNGERFANPTTHFSIDDDYYQAFIRYVPKRLLTTRYFAYLRGGVSYVKATLQDQATFPQPVGRYSQTDNTTDILGNFGFGLGRYIYRGERLRVALQLEGEGFYGVRSQDTQESLPDFKTNFPRPGIHPNPITGPTVSFDDDLYGGIGRGTVRVQYAFGKLGLLKAFGDFGAEAKYTLIHYPGTGTFSGGSFNELLWGPYVKVGLRYDF